MSSTQPSSGDIVISGISGRFPSSDSIQEFKDNLYHGVDMVTADSTRWPIGESLLLFINPFKMFQSPPGLWDLPPCSGKVKSFDKFDNEFFGYDAKQVDYVDPQDRKLLETTFEALIDAG